MNWRDLQTVTAYQPDLMALDKKMKCLFLVMTNLIHLLEVIKIWRVKVFILELLRFIKVLKAFQIWILKKISF